MASICRWIFCCFNCIDDELEGKNPLEHIKELEQEADEQVDRVRNRAMGRVKEVEGQISEKVQEVRDEADEQVDKARTARKMLMVMTMMVMMPGSLCKMMTGMITTTTMTTSVPSAPCRPRKRPLERPRRHTRAARTTRSRLPCRLPRSSQHPRTRRHECWIPFISTNRYRAL
ncbi:hypothetical protein DENSPDRAFT_677547 [Dentipellis sp. KUC8613]|nr:hypothetical protein DENSPDRAFT_677547 [Dentipellis sp. KUC8613]